MRLSEQASGSWIRRSCLTAVVAVAMGYGVLWLVGRALHPYQEWSKSVECKRNIHFLVRGANMYADDYDGRYMLAERWEESLEPYAPPRYRACPSVDSEAGTGYAADAERSGAERTKLEDESKASLLYDSAHLVRNARGRREDLPVPGRHTSRGRTERSTVRGNWIGYADGSCRFQPDTAPVR